MNTNLTTTLMLGGFLLLSACTQTESANLSSLESEARDLTQQFVATLLPTLQNAMAQGGPTEAIAVCSVRAPQIAEELSADSGWNVRRVSLKPRNASLAIPDEWERLTLQDFDRRQQGGEAGPTISASAVVDGEYRYMQAQPTMPLCLTCHGQTVATEVRSALAEHYPMDLATGYTQGQIRGAISLRRPVLFDSRD
jgi:hypothetical protein